MEIQKGYVSIEQMVSNLERSKTGNATESAEKNAGNDSISFLQVFEQTRQNKEAEQVTGLKFSKHANQRLSDRNIDLTQNQLERLEEGTRKAKEKGINESLVMIDDLAFIVNIKNNTVVTAVNQEKENIFTNIDGAVIS